MEGWMFAWLVRSGIVRSDGVTRRVGWSRCPGCGEGVLRALDGDVCAVAVSLDVGAVDRVGEAVALSLGLRSFDMLRMIHQKAYSFCIVPRKAYHIRKASQCHPVYIEHRCGLVIPKIKEEMKGYPDEAPF